MKAFKAYDIRGIWGEDLNGIPGLTDLLTKDLEMIQAKGMRETVKSIICIVRT